MRFTLGALVVLCPALAGAAAEDTIYTRASLVAAEPEPVVIWNRTITEYRAAVAGVSARERAERAVEQIAAIPYERLTDPIEIASVTAGELSGLQVFVGRQPVITLLAEDLPAESGLTLEQYARDASSNLKDVLEARIAQRRPQVLLLAIGMALLATLAYVALLLGLGKLRRRAEQAASGIVSRRPMRVAQLDLRPVLGSLLQGLASLLLISVVIGLTYAWLTFVLTQFPYSRPVASRLGHWLAEQLRDFGAGIADALPGLFTVVLIFLVARLASRAISGFFARIESRAISVSWLVPATARTTRALVLALIWLFALVFAYPHIPGSGTDAFKGISVLVGLMISLGSAGFINQFMSGLVIVYSRALSIGDVAKIGEVTGVVQRVGLLSTRLLTSREEVVTIPNAVVVGNRVTSYVRPDEAIDAQLAVTVTIGYDAPWRQVHGLLLQAATRTAGIRRDPQPYVLQRALSDFYVEYELRVKLEAGQSRFRVESDLHAAIQDAFNDAGVQIMSPHFESQPAEKVYAPRTT